jgi:hypothetical protein
MGDIIIMTANNGTSGAFAKSFAMSQPKPTDRHRT